MKKRIFKSIFSAAILVFLAGMILILGVLYLQYNREYTRELKTETGMLAKSVEQGGAEYLKSIESSGNPRITWISKSGEVLYDSSAKAEDMKDHGGRPEVRAAMKEGEGISYRYSDTLKGRNIYYAKRLEDGSVLRTAETQPTLFALLVKLTKPVALILLLSVILSLFFASRLAKKIMQPVNDIDLNHPEKAEIYEEVNPLIEKICEQNEALKSRISRLETDVDEKTREADFRKEFTANVSHELKTPLTSISGFAEIIKNGIAKADDIPRFAGKIYDETQRLIRLVEDILKLAQLDELQIGIEEQEIDLYEVCEEIVEVLLPAAKKREVSVMLTGEHCTVMAVDRILGEIIYNLCDNAIKYNRIGGKVNICVHMEQGRPAVSVKDTGIGIPEEDIDRIFERFYRVNKSHSKEIGGTGLGLSIVKHGAAYHNAEIRTKSCLGQGTEITVIF